MGIKSTFTGYVAYGLIGRTAVIYYEMEKSGYLKPYCENYGKDYQTAYAVAKFAEPFINGDASELKMVKDEWRKIKENERVMLNMELELNF